MTIISKDAHDMVVKDRHAAAVEEIVRLVGAALTRRAVIPARVCVRLAVNRGNWGGADIQDLVGDDADLLALAVLEINGELSHGGWSHRVESSGTERWWRHSYVTLRCENDRLREVWSSGPAGP